MLLETVCVSLNPVLEVMLLYTSAGITMPSL